MAASLSALQSLGQSQPEYEMPPLYYSNAAASNCITDLQRLLESRAVRLEHSSDKQKLASLLQTLGVPVESQVLVFSKTSLQRQLIGPRRPRSIYFSDDCYIGWVPGGLMEATVSDEKLGLAFYRSEPVVDPATVRFIRDSECLSCHGGSMTRNWPGLVVRSVFPNERGDPITSAGGFLIGHGNPLSERWGGWYVTGRHGTDRHMGNVIAREAVYGAELDRESGANLERLNEFFRVEDYLRPDSDIVALMVLEHQVEMHNRLAQGNLRARRWIHQQKQLQKELGEPESSELTGTAKLVVNNEAQRIVECMLFCGEARLPQEGISGAGQFEPAFRANAHRDQKGRSLKDFELRTRLFKYRCSYMIYSQAFEHLPPELKTAVYRRLREILTSEVAGPKFAHLSSEERLAICEILKETKPDWERH